MSEQKPKIQKAHCPKCGPSRASDVLGEYIESWEDDQYPVSGQETYRLLRCRGCLKVYFQQASWFSEDPEDLTYSYWPSPSRRNKPDWVLKLHGDHGALKELIDEIYSALDVDLRTLAAIGIRTAFDKAAELLKVKTILTFNQKLDELKKRELIGAEERQSLDVLVNAGSAAAHRSWKPMPEELDTMMSTLESFVYRTFVLRHAVKKLNASVPTRKRTKKKSPATTGGKPTGKP